MNDKWFEMIKNKFIKEFDLARTTQQPHVPQVPQRPIEYTRSSTNQLHSISSEAENQVGLRH